MKQSGFTLLEVMIALLILSVGVLGVASLQVKTYKQLQASYNMGRASILAGEMSDRMVANADEARAGAYIHSTQLGATPRDCGTHNDGCNAVQWASYDRYIWQSKIASIDADGVPVPGSLPSASGAVARIGSTNDFLVTVRWDDDLSGSTGTNCPPQDSADLDCYQLTVAF